MKSIELYLDFAIEGDDLRVRIPATERAAVAKICAAAAARHNPQLLVRMSVPSRKKTTGARSQNNRIHGEIRHLAQQLNKRFDEVFYDVVFNVAHERGYPFVSVNTKDGRQLMPRGLSEITHEDAQILIDSINQYADENNLSVLEYTASGGVIETIGGEEVKV